MWSRRQWLLGAGALGVGTFLIKPDDQGQPHNPYFRHLQQHLHQHGLGQPLLVVDQVRLEANIERVRHQLATQRLPCRLVVKSLPSLPLLQQISTRLNTHRYMVFNLAMLDTLLAHHHGQPIDILFGKPQATAAIATWLQQDAPHQRPALAQIQWLVDSPARVSELAALAQRLGVQLRINLELDVGLHRGGLPSVGAFAQVLDRVLGTEHLRFAGVMAYDAHVAKMPNVAGMQQRAWALVQDTLQQVKAHCVQRDLDLDQLTFNSGGSPTYQRHAKHTEASELAIGSAFVQPADFDDTVMDHQPACWIATPVLKQVNPALIPALEWAASMRQWWDPNLAQGVFIHGGHWLARSESPTGLQRSGLYGVSSNQELWLGSAAQQLKVNDWVFFRPTQSEAVFLQFAEVFSYHPTTAQLTRWSVFPASA